MQVTTLSPGPVSRPDTPAAAAITTSPPAPLSLSISQSISHTSGAELATVAAQHASRINNAAITTSPVRAQDLQAQLARALNDVYPDIRAHAKASIETRIASEYHIKIDADQTYYNWFGRSAARPFPASQYQEGAWHGVPTTSQSLTDVQLASSGSAASPLQNAGVFREGAWSHNFDDHNRIPLTPEQVRSAAQDSQFHLHYAAQLRTFWNENFDSLRTLTELQILDYVENHRRAGNRARALGIDTRLELSDEALAMVAEATRRKDPDKPPVGVKTYVFNINGWPAEDMVWLRSNEGRIVLVMPGDERPLREYRDLQQMQDDIRQMVRTKAGRDKLASHFSAYYRRDSAFRWGVNSWLAAIAKDRSGQYDYAIANYYKKPVDGSITIGVPDAHGRSLLSDKAVAMLSRAAGYPESDQRTQDVRAYWLDLNGIASPNTLWLQASDGHVVLLMTGDPQPVREYANLEAMRSDIANMARDAAGRQYLATRFAPADRTSTATFEGIDHWLSKIPSGGATMRKRIAFDARRNAIDGQIFQHLLLNQRQQELSMIDDLAAGHPSPGLVQEKLEREFSRNRRIFNTMRMSDDICDAELNVNVPDMPARTKRSPTDDPIDACLLPRTRPLSWGRALVNRMRAAIDRLRSAPRILPEQLPHAAVESPRTLANDYTRRPETLPAGRQVNVHGFLENNDLYRLYRVEMIVTDPRDTRDLYLPVADPLIAGFIPDIYFAAGRRALDGNVIDAYLTPLAAWNAFAMRHNNVARPGQVEFRLYEIDPHGLSAVSFGENATLNPQFPVLMADRGDDTYVHRRGGAYVVQYSGSAYRKLEGQMVQLALNDSGLRGRAHLRESRQPNAFGGVERI